MLQGATSIPLVRKVPLAGPAARSFSSYSTCASFATSATVRSVSYSIVSLRVVGTDGVEDLLVRLLRRLRRADVAHVLQRLDQQVAVGRDGRGEQLVPGGIGDRDVERHARLGVWRLLADHGAAVVHAERDARDRSDVSALGRELARRSLHDGAGFGEA